MLSLSSVFPKDSHELWYTPSYRPHAIQRSTRPNSKYIPGSGIYNDYDEFPKVPNTPHVGPSRKLSSLELAEAEHIKYIESVRSFGYTFMRPPGFTKTEQAILEEQALSDSEPDDNGLMENPDGEPVIIDGEQQDDQATVGEDDQSYGDRVDEQETEGVDIADEEDESGELDQDDGDDEALDGWPRRPPRRRYRVNAFIDEVDLDADIPEGDDLRMAYDEDFEDDEFEENPEVEYSGSARDELREYSAGYDDDDDEEEEEVGLEQNSGSSLISRSHGLSLRSPRAITSAVIIPSDDDYEMGMELDDDNE